MLKNLRTFNPKEIEERVLKFWEENHIFEKSVKQRKKPFSFYDGPPFATGLPHYGHILATAIKDTVLRFWTMMGFKIERRVGWDCHGLPVENLIEKELGLKNKKAIEEMGIENFNNACRAAVFRSVDDFEKTLKRVGRWADYSNCYATMDNNYTESVWWVFKELWENNLIYKDFRITPYCPRCGTPLSNFEVNQGYKEVEDTSVFVKFKIQNSKFKNSYFLVWTTTPWTLPGNTALAVNPKIQYVKIKLPDVKAADYLILAKDRLAVIKEPYQIVEEIKGSKLEGLRYEPLYPIRELFGERSMYSVYGAKFVSIEDGSGIVHIAPAFGEDDYKLMKSEFLAAGAIKGSKPHVPITVNEDGTMKKGVIGEGLFVKEADQKIIKDLEERNILYKGERAIHNYPFCWRCDTPLLYYPIDSWYVNVVKFRDKLVKNNKKIYWMPEYVGSKRFGKWLSEARDWAISRNRFWGAALPVWECESCKKHSAIGSLKELAELAVSSGNKYFVLRHGEAVSNVLGISSCEPEKSEIKLTEKGREEIKKLIPELKSKKIDLIFSSPLLRTKESAEIIDRALKVKLYFDDRLREYNTGVFNGESVQKFREFIGEEVNKFKKTPDNGENLNDVRERIMNFISEIERKYQNKNILIVGHGDPLWVLEGAGQGLSDEEIVKIQKNYIKLGELREIKFLNLPYDKKGKLDLHRPYIDEIKLKCPDCGVKAKRIAQVFDCWFESGSMPYGQWHYPFQNKKLVENTFPADFVAEGMDQTRGWFYTLHVLSTALTLKNIGLGKDSPSFKNVVVNGLILDEFGRKLSKKLRNYTEPEIIFDKFGADALRFFLLSSTPIGEDYRFSDKGVEEVKRKVIDRLINSYAFFNLYGNKKTARAKPNSLLDKWILSRLHETIFEMTKQFKRYDLTAASRLIIGFLGDLSNWYIRRSRRRFQKPEKSARGRKDYISASVVLRQILIEIAKLMAPISPFVSEAVYKSLSDKKESVHLEDWPVYNRKFIDKKLFRDMAEIRNLASLVLAKRAEAGIKVRQPLGELKIKNQELKNKKELLDILKDEINVREIVFDKKIKDEILLNTEITADLKEEGTIREFARMVQDLRQEASYEPKDRVRLWVQGLEEFEKTLNRNLPLIKKEVNADIIEFGRTDKFDAEADKEIDNQPVWLAIKKN